jgi:hypothetical protein
MLTGINKLEINRSMWRLIVCRLGQCKPRNLRGMLLPENSRLNIRNEKGERETNA